MDERTDSGEGLGVSAGFGSPARLEDGRISLLFIGLMIIVLAFVLVATAISIVHVQDRRLLACADRVSAVASEVMDASVYYGSGPGDPVLVPDEVGAQSAAVHSLHRLAASTCHVGQGVRLESVVVREDQVVIIVRSRVHVPLIPQILGEVGDVELTATSSARTR